MFRRWSYIISVTFFEIRSYILKEIEVVFNRVYVWHEWCHISRRRYRVKNIDGHTLIIFSILPCSNGFKIVARVLQTSSI